MYNSHALGEHEAHSSDFHLQRFTQGAGPVTFHPTYTSEGVVHVQLGRSEFITTRLSGSE
jgi:hypothetical protein